MNLITVQRIQSPNDFVGYWRQFYNYRNEHDYTSALSKSTLTTQDILQIYQWKNNIGKDGKSMSKSKHRFVRNIQMNIDVVNALKANFDLERFKAAFENLSAIWGILLLHVIKPDDFPLYDRHVHRAFRFITAGVNEMMPGNNQQKYQVYYSSYVYFFSKFYSKTTGFTVKQVDDALMMFGRFLSRYPITAENISGLS